MDVRRVCRSSGRLGEVYIEFGCCFLGGVGGKYTLGEFLR